MRGLLVFLTAAAAVAVAAAPYDIGADFARKEAWTGKSEFYAVEHKDLGFVFASEDRDIVNCLRHGACTWFGLPVWEAKVFFDKAAEEERVVRVELSLYNRGDAEAQRADAMEVAELKRMIAEVDAKGGGAKIRPVKTQLASGGVKYRKAYPAADPAMELAWGLSAADSQKNRSVEFLRLTLTPKETGRKVKGGTKSVSGDRAKAKIRDNVAKIPSGDVYVDGVPMVDQGQKGYCAAAVAERVLRYYGNAIDEHEIAQLAGTSARQGTSVSDMKAAVTAIGAKCRLGYQDIVAMTSTIGDLDEEIARYNKAAKVEKKPEISMDMFRHGNMISISEMREAMDKKVIYRMRQKDPRLKKFLVGVRQQVNAGVPVIWGVTLGIFPERGVNPQTAGGHMRLIIGYNDKKHEILYTDTWGEGHELKRMPEDWAFAITHDAFFLKPR